MPNLNINLTNIEDTLKAEAAPVVLELACRVVIARTNAARPSDESMAAKSIRGMMRGDFQARIAKAMTDEERGVQQIGDALGRAKGAVLDGLGATMSVARNPDETDEDFRARLGAANNLEDKPVRTAIRDAADALVAALLEAPGPVMALVTATADEMSQS